MNESQQETRTSFKTFMADPKYANLYGIAHDQPDVYETNDLPEADQTEDIYEEKSGAIERLHISAPEAYSKFRGKEVDARHVDFSDRIGRNRANGYNVRSNEWELAGLGETETPLEKYKRLKLETEHLLEEVTSLSSEPHDLVKSSDNEEISKDELKKMISAINNIKLEDKIGSNLIDNVSKTERLQFEKVLCHLDTLSKELQRKPEHDEAAATTIISELKMAMQYVLSMRPNQQTQFTSRITNLEKRIDKLETLLGTRSNQALRLCNTNIDDGLINSCQWMIAKLSLLDSAQLDFLESKISNINTKIEQYVNVQSSLAQDPEKEKKINELYQLSYMGREKICSISNIVERLVALESMHKQGKQSVQSITHLETLQTKLAANLAENNAVLNEFRGTLRSNLETIKGTVETLKMRVEALGVVKK